MFLRDIFEGVAFHFCSNSNFCIRLLSYRLVKCRVFLLLQTSRVTFFGRKQSEQSPIDVHSFPIRFPQLHGLRARIVEFHSVNGSCI
jgi:hypothetical protein